MLLAANKPNLKKHAPALLGNNWSPENEKRLIAACLAEIEYRPGIHRSHDEAAHLEKIDALLGNCGIESFLKKQVSVVYSNTGETYGMTILFVNGKLKLGDWGSVVESLTE